MESLWLVAAENVNKTKQSQHQAVRFFLFPLSVFILFPHFCSNDFLFVCFHSISSSRVAFEKCFSLATIPFHWLCEESANERQSRIFWLVAIFFIIFYLLNFSQYMVQEPLKTEEHWMRCDMNASGRSRK